MRLARTCFALLAPALLSGCGYVHFGRLEKTPAAGGDAALATAYTNLSTENKILKQELMLTRKEGDTLRIALDRASGSAAAEVIARLNETTRELATLRASYASLQAERAAGGSPSTAEATSLRSLEDKLAGSLRNYTQLQEENARLRRELDRTRSENVALGDQLKTSVAQNEDSKHTLEMLNLELLAQKQARASAEQSTAAVRTQLNLVLAQGSGGATGSPGAARDSGAALQLSRSPSADATPTAALRTDTDRLRRASASAAPGGAPAQPPRVHVVQAADTLEKISLKYYGVPDRWRAIYEANQALLSGGQPLRVGMELQLP